MKVNKLMLAALFLGAFAFASCDKKDEKQEPVTPVTPVTPDEPVDPVEPGEDIPDVDEPEDGFVTFVLQIPEGTECNGIAIKGTYDGAAWSGADTYLGKEGSVSAKEAILFEQVEGTKTFFKATFPLGEAGIEGKVCLVYAGDGSWQGQAVNMSVNEDFSTADVTYGGDNFKVTTSGLVYFVIGGWQSSECATPVDYTLTFKTTPWCGDDMDLEVVGSMNDWGGEGYIVIPVTKVSDTEYTVTFKATANAQLKIRSVGSWTAEIQQLVDGEWKGAVDNVTLTEDTKMVVDYTDAETFRWSVCAAEE